MHELYQEILSAKEYTYKIVDAERIRTAVQRPLWYLEDPIRPYIAEYFASRTVDQPYWHTARAEVWRLFTDLLEQGSVRLGNRPEFFNDDDRTYVEKRHKPIKPDVTDYVVVHHTATPGISLRQLNALGLLRLYAPIYDQAAFYQNGEPQPISSGHYYRFPWNLAREQVFWGYHHMIYPNGSSYRLLDDRYMGFHAGNLQVNRISVAVAFMGDYSQRAPNDRMLQTAARVIRQYPDIRIVGHCEVPNPRLPGATIETACPGVNFISRIGWKRRLEELVDC